MLKLSFFSGLKLYFLKLKYQFLPTCNFAVFFNTVKNQEIKLFTLLSRCEVSLPQKTSPACMLKRRLERTTMKHLWTLTENKFGFMMLNRTPTEHVFKTFIDPFSRFNMEQYIQTVLTSDLTHSVYHLLVKNASEIQHNYNYNILSKYFGMASKLGGVSIISSSRRLWQA